MGECFNCAGEAREQYTLILDNSGTLEGKWLCEPCISDLRNVGWIETREALVLTGRGNDDHGGGKTDGG